MFRPELIRAVALGVASLAFATLLMFSSGYLISRVDEQDGIRTLGCAAG